MTTFNDMVQMFGGLPALAGVPFGKDAKYYFVDPVNGTAGGAGTSPATAVTTVTIAYDKTVDKRGDVIYLMNDGNTTGTSRDAATITWATG